MSLDKDTLAALSQGPAIEAAERAAHGALPKVQGLLALPNNFQTHNLENLLPLRRRARGAMTTSVIEHFAQYVGQHAEAGASVFVDPDKMTATAVLNLGTPDEPGHADNTATFAPKATAAYKALAAIIEGNKTQQQVAEFLEDWAPLLKATRDDVEMELKHAIAAVRTITIEALRKTESTEEQLSASRSALDSVKAEGRNGNPLPTRFEFRCAPYVGIGERTFAMRLVIHIGEKAPTIGLRIVKAAEHAEEMAKELVAKVTAAIGDKAPVLIGSYSTKT
jgi:uncharacterized protein YfdQ (DUF2303 family)